MFAVKKNIARSLFSLQINPPANAPGAKKTGEIRYNGTFAPAAVVECVVGTRAWLLSHIPNLAA
ncbi:hypothetical protein [Paraburkholderia diazotrophica]|uniref:hypothetical protein n=1 Tax=Paraburkholderia diazotrophica TaxID=667676 RepID=UPI003177E965